MLARVLPPAAACVETRRDGDDLVPPAESEAIASAVESRRLEFATARGCARRALAELGRTPVAIPRGAHGAPIWPVGIVGSITHCEGYRASAVARRDQVAALGIDAEPNGKLPPRVLTSIANPAERERLRALTAADGGTCWDRLLFSAKEAAYKAWFPFTGERLGFADADIVLSPAGSFVARLTRHRSSTPPRCSLPGKWALADGILVTAIALPSTTAHYIV